MYIPIPKKGIALDVVVMIVSTGVTIWVSIAVSDARTDIKLQNQEKRLDYNTGKRDSLEAELKAVGERTARTEEMVKFLVERAKLKP